MCKHIMNENFVHHHDIVYVLTNTEIQCMCKCGQNWTAPRDREFHPITLLNCPNDGQPYETK
jgi:hypothetical protein